MNHEKELESAISSVCYAEAAIACLIIIGVAFVASWII